MSDSKQYSCVVTPTDKIEAYATLDGEPPGAEVFAIVATNAQGHKVSVLLNAADAEDLYAQLNEFCFGVAE